MAGHIRVAVGYDMQIAIDTKHKLIVEQEDRVVDMDLLKQTAQPARVILGVEQIDVAADCDYLKIENIDACEKAGLTPVDHDW